MHKIYVRYVNQEGVTECTNKENAISCIQRLYHAHKEEFDSMESFLKTITVVGLNAWDQQDAIEKAFAPYNDDKYIIRLNEGRSKVFCEDGDAFNTLCQLYLNESNICMGDFLDTLSIEGLSIQGTVDLFARVMNQFEKEMLIQFQDPVPTDLWVKMVNHLKTTVRGY